MSSGYLRGSEKRELKGRKTQCLLVEKPLATEGETERGLPKIQMHLLKDSL